MARTAVLGFPRVGADRELKLALEAHWAGRLAPEELQATARTLRAQHLGRSRQAGIDVLPVGDHALYDHVLDAAELVGIVAERHGGANDDDGTVVDSADALRRHFLACRGDASTTPLEMTKWLDTNYHYLVPELAADQTFRLRPARWLAHLAEAREVASPDETLRPVVLGPLSLLLLAKPAEGAGEVDRLALLEPLTAVYGELLDRLAAEGVTEVQLDEPVLVLDRTDAELDAFARAYGALAAGTDRPGIALATYFDRLDERTLARIGGLRLAELHVDLVRAPDQLDAVLDALPGTTRLSAGVVDGRNVWATDMDRALDRLDRIVARIGSDRLTIAPSCSLLHVPYRASRETGLDDELRSWLAFGEEKLDELALLQRALDADAAGRDALLADARARTS
ncbi:MAG: 5-methyltetrahydropteroyltriglutamate--homocysteine S-methyltransferase, partial [Patulibacter sp.]